MRKEIELHKDVQELMEDGIDVEGLKARVSYLIDTDGNNLKYDRSYLNPVGVEVIILKSF